MASLRTESKVTVGASEARNFLQFLKNKHAEAAKNSPATPNFTLDLRDRPAEGMQNGNYSIYGLSVRPIAGSEEAGFSYLENSNQLVERFEDSLGETSAKERVRWHLGFPQGFPIQDLNPSNAVPARLADQDVGEVVKLEWKVKDPHDPRIVHKYSNVLSKQDVEALQSNPDAATRTGIIERGLALTLKGRPVNDPEVLRNLIMRKSDMDTLVHEAKGRLPQNEIAVAYQRDAYVMTLRDGQTLQLTVDSDVHGTDLKTQQKVSYPSGTRVLELKVPIELANRFKSGDLEGLKKDGFSDYLEVQQAFNALSGLPDFTRDRGKFYHVLKMLVKRYGEAGRSSHPSSPR